MLDQKIKNYTGRQSKQRQAHDRWLNVLVAPHRTEFFSQKKTELTGLQTRIKKPGHNARNVFTNEDGLPLISIEAIIIKPRKIVTLVIRNAKRKANFKHPGNVHLPRPSIEH